MKYNKNVQSFDSSWSWLSHLTFLRLSSITYKLVIPGFQVSFFSFLFKIRANVSVNIWHITTTQYMMIYDHCGYFKIPSRGNVLFFICIRNGPGNVTDLTVKHLTSEGEFPSNKLNGNQCFGKEPSVFPRKAFYPLE